MAELSFYSPPRSFPFMLNLYQVHLPPPNYPPRNDIILYSYLLLFFLPSFPATLHNVHPSSLADQYNIDMYHKLGLNYSPPHMLSHSQPKFSLAPSQIDAILYRMPTSPWHSPPSRFSCLVYSPPLSNLSCVRAVRVKLGEQMSFFLEAWSIYSLAVPAKQRGLQTQHIWYPRHF